MRRGSGLGLALGIVTQRLGRLAGRHPVGAVLALCALFALLGQPVLAGVVALVVVLLAGVDEPWRERWRRRWPR